MSAEERHVEALKYKEKQKGKLTEKQFSVYGYLLSKSWYNAQDEETHYYVYRNSFKIVDACKSLHMTDTTWRNAIKKLIELRYISLSANGEYYTIKLPAWYASLHIDLIRDLLCYGSVIRNGGIIVALYSAIRRYYEYCKENHSPCELTVTQLCYLFYGDHRRSDQMMAIRIMLSFFKDYGLIKYELVPKVLEGVGKEYLVYKVSEVATKSSEKLSLATGEDNINNIKKEMNKIIVKFMEEEKEKDVKYDMMIV